MFRSMYLLLPHGVPLSCIICFTMGQEFTLVPEPVYQLTGSNHSIELIWNFEHDGIALSGTTWRNGDNILVMKQTGNQTPVVSNDFIDRVSHRTPFGLSIWNLTKEDEGEYTCRVVYIGGQKQSKVNVTLYDIDGGLSPKIELYGDGAGIEEETGVIVKSNLTAKYFVPIQNPVAITTTISTDFIGSVEIRETCNDYNGTYCEVTFTAPNKTGKLIISACNSHPALTDELCERLAVNIIDKGPDDPGAECKWWCILLIVLPMVIVVIVIICCCWHYKVACFRHKSSAQIDVNQKQETNGFGMENKAY